MVYEAISKKIKIISIVAMIIFASIIIKLAYTQVMSYELLTGYAHDLWQRSFPVEADRGEIVDANGDAIATSITTVSLVVLPNQVKDPQYAAKEISRILNVDMLVIYEKITKAVSIERLQPEGRQLSDDVAKQIDALKIPGVYLIKDTKRYYPYGNYLAQTLGFVGIDNQGLAGLELKYDNYLQGKKGTLNYYVDAKNNSLPLLPSLYESPASGMDVKLTINMEIQDIMERELNNAVAKYNPECALAIAMNPKTGAILALSSKPDFDPNNYSASTTEIINRNLPVWKSYEPGSTFKILTFASALEENLFDMNKDTYYDKGYEMVGGARIKSWKAGGHGLQTYLQVLQNSSNPGFVEIGRKLGKENLLKYINLFGFGQKTGVDIVGESTGIMFKEENFGPVEQATVAFGQGISITPLQLVTAVSSVVNGGNLMKPYILDEILNPLTGEVLQKTEPEVVRQTISAATSEQMKYALETVVTDGGGKAAFINGYRIGGKSGTAQIAENGAYSTSRYILSFIAMAPMDDPEIVLYVAIENPKNTTQYGGVVTAPIVRSMLVDMLPALGVKKVTEQREKQYSWLDPTQYLVPNYVGLKKSDVKSQGFKIVYQGEGDYIIDQLPRTNEKIERGKEIILMLGDKYER